MSLSRIRKARHVVLSKNRVVDRPAPLQDISVENSLSLPVFLAIFVAAMELPQTTRPDGIATGDALRWNCYRRCSPVGFP